MKLTFEKYQRLLADGFDVVPFCQEVSIGEATPLALYDYFKKYRQGGSFLFESAERYMMNGRYSILGVNPKWTLQAWGKRIEISGEKQQSFEVSDHLLAELERQMKVYKPAEIDEGLPFCGGLVGYLGYDSISQFEPTVRQKMDGEGDLEVPDGVFFLPTEVVVFDHMVDKYYVIFNHFVQKGEAVREDYDSCCVKLQDLVEQLQQATVVGLPAVGNRKKSITRNDLDYHSNTSQKEFLEMVSQAKEAIAAGEAFQIVVGQRFETFYQGGVIDLYRSLLSNNPSPYMFILDLADFCLVGSSPEVQVKCQNSKVEVRPIAGTRPRGKDEAEDRALAQSLLNDPKEMAEHMMLVDLARNDIGRIAKIGSVNVDDFGIIEKYSQVMHVVSNVSGILDENHSVYDVFRTTFPAGTVSGAPKIRAMQILGKLEKSRRNTYAGAVAYFSWTGNLDSCITLRTCLLKDEKAYVQAGAGIVADSDAVYEYKESCSKASGVLIAIEEAKCL